LNCRREKANSLAVGISELTQIQGQPAILAQRAAHGISGSTAAIASNTPAKVSVTLPLASTLSMRNIVTGCIAKFQPEVFTRVEPGSQTHWLIRGLFIKGEDSIARRFNPVNRHSDHCRNQMLLVPIVNEDDIPLGIVIEQPRLVDRDRRLVVKVTRAKWRNRKSQRHSGHWKKILEHLVFSFRKHTQGNAHRGPKATPLSSAK
jgi:hypothetical protein